MRNRNTPITIAKGVNRLPETGLTDSFSGLCHNAERVQWACRGADRALNQTARDCIAAEIYSGVAQRPHRPAFSH